MGIGVFLQANLPTASLSLCVTVPKEEGLCCRKEANRRKSNSSKTKGVHLFERQNVVFAGDFSKKQPERRGCLCTLWMIGAPGVC